MPRRAFGWNVRASPSPRLSSFACRRDFMRLGIRRYVLLLIAVFALVSMALAACGGSTTQGGGKAPDSKQILHYPVVNNASDLAHLDPPKIGDFYSQQVAMLVFPPLVELNDNLQ